MKHEHWDGTIRQGIHPLPFSFEEVRELEALMDERLRTAIPPLEYALTQAVFEHNPDAMLKRLSMLPYAHISPFFLEGLWKNVLRFNKPHVVFSHGPTRTADEKVGLLRQYGSLFHQAFGADSPLPQPVKTRTVQYEIDKNKYAYLLLAGIGDRRPTKQEIRSITGTKKNTMNPSVFSPEANLGVYSGVVSPFLDPESTRGITSIVWLHDDLPDDHPVEIAASPIDSVVISKHDLSLALQADLVWSFGEALQIQPGNFFTRYQLNLDPEMQMPILIDR